jgi:hypothetical protein
MFHFATKDVGHRDRATGTSWWCPSCQQLVVGPTLTAYGATLLAERKRQAAEANR